MGFGVGLVLLAAGCQGALAPPENLQVAIATGEGRDAVVRTSLQKLASQMVGEFMRNHPGTNLHLRFLPESELLESVRARAGLGAGPDLLISRTAPVLTLREEGLVAASNLGPEQLDPLRIQFLSSFRDGNHFTALPFLLQPSLACFDRRRLPNPPKSLEELLARSSEGLRVGLPLQLDELIWSASGFGADTPLINLFSLRPSAAAYTVPATERQKIITWLSWLYRANVQPSLQYVETSDELVQRLGARQLDWISCNATAIPMLRRKLGTRLGVSLLPAGPDGKPARPLSRLLLLSFGRDSTPNQRRIAESFALFVLNDFSQNNLMVRAFGNMPVNQNVIVPVKESSDLAVMETSLANSTVPSFRRGVGLRKNTEPLRQLLKQTVYGEVPPERVLAGIEAVARSFALRASRKP